jgi:ubiquinone/menaquinone biosynthesis C-methylase UbiE
VIESLKLKDGSAVADAGCGVGYFSLKLAPKVAEHGSVLAEDVLGVTPSIQHSRHSR